MTEEIEKTSILDLENKASLPNLEKEIRFEIDGIEHTYVGKLFKIRINRWKKLESERDEKDNKYKLFMLLEDQITLVASLKAYRIESYTMPGLRWRKEKLKINRSYDTRWVVSTPFQGLNWVREQTPFYFVGDEKREKSKILRTYRTALQEGMDYHNIQLQKEVIDKIFNPLEDQIVEMHNRMITREREFYRRLKS
jgi:hypothetical protein